MKLFASWIGAAFLAPQIPSPQNVETTTGVTIPSFLQAQSELQQQQQQSSLLLNPFHDAASTWLASSASAPPPSPADITLLRQAFAEFYGVERDLSKSLDLLNQVIDKWQGQPADELAGLYRVRGDCYMLLANADAARQDYDAAVQLLQGPGGSQADPVELPTALLGRARATKSLGRTTVVGKNQAGQVAADYQLALKLSSREEWDTDEELIDDGASRNPYAAWEWGTVLRWDNRWKEAATAHLLAADAFADIGDTPRAVISKVDAGIDLVAAASIQGKNDETAVSMLETAISKTKGVEGRDVKLLQRVIVKEGEGRMALAAYLWDQGQRQDAETVLGDACIRLEQLQADAAQRASVEAAKKQAQGSTSASSSPTSMAASSGGLLFSIDDDIPSSGMSCYKFKNPTFLTEQLGWPEQLQKKVIKLQTLR